MNDYKPKYARDAAEGQVRKQEFIKASQDTKELGFRVNGSATDATLMVTAMKDIYLRLAIEDKMDADEFMKVKWEMWRKWFYEKRDPNKTVMENEEPF